MKEFFRKIQRDTVLAWSFWVTIVLVFVMIGGIIVSYTNLAPVIPLYNHMPWGYARLGKTYELFMLPLLVLGICIVNSIFGIQILNKIPLLARFLFLTTISLAFFTCIFIIRLIFITL